MKITVPIRISQAQGDTRVNPAKTRKLITQLRAIDGQGPITEVFYDPGVVARPDPPTLGEHFGLLVDDNEITEVVAWAGQRLAGAAADPGGSATPAG